MNKERLTVVFTWITYLVLIGICWVLVLENFC